MAEQLDMLQSLDPQWRGFVRGLLADVPRARRTDPETSHAAARELKQSGRLTAQQQRVLAAVESHPGRTSAELGHMIAEADGLDGMAWRYIAARRLPELAPFYVRRASPRTCEKTGRAATTWYAVRHQRAPA